MLNIIFLGPPGAGKGTVAQEIGDKFGLIQISTGDLIRAEVKTDSELGKKLKSIIESGKLVSDEIVEKIIENKLNEIKKSSSIKGVIFDGFPRTIPQAKELENILSKINEKLNAVIYIDSSKDSIVKRLSSRRSCKSCGKIYNLVTMPPKEEGKCDIDGGFLYQRDDDKEEIISDRFNEYNEKTFPLIEFYENKGILKKYDGDVPPKESVDIATKIIEEIISESN
jgi:adenylate kinase